MAAAETAKTPDMLSGRKHAPARLGRVLVLGLGKSGRAAVDYCASLIGTRVDALVVAAGARNAEAEEFARSAEARGARVVFDTETVEGAYDVCIASPGIPQTSAFYANAVAACGEVISEIEFAWRESAAESRWVAITGTNGKTTTTSLAAAALREAGMNARAVGNIGDVSLDAVAAGDTDVYVAEVSSYQLASTRLFAPDAAVVLNITPDHLSWHGGFEAYAEAKFKALANLAGVPGAVAVLAATDDRVRAKVRELKALGAGRGFDYVPIGTAAGLRESMIERCGAEAAAFVDADGSLRIDLRGATHRVGAVADLAVKGEHNVENALAAAAAAIALGASDDAIARAFATFSPLEHRIEPCGSVNGVSFVNDSKATNVDATIRAFSAFPDGTAVVLLGGCDKMTDLAPLVEAVRAHAKAAVCFGDAGERFVAAFCQTPQSADAAASCSTESGRDPETSRAEARVGSAIPPISGTAETLADFSGNAAPAAIAADVPLGTVARDAAGFPVARAEHLADAFEAAVALACPGDVVLLSPACSSFDEFSCFEERGRAFKALAAAHGAVR